MGFSICLYHGKGATHLLTKKPFPLIYRRRDLISSAMTDSPPYFAQTSCILSQYSEFLEQEKIVFYHLRDATDVPPDWAHSEPISLCCCLNDRLLSLKLHKPPEEMMLPDYLFESYRLGALIYLQCIFHKPEVISASLQNLKDQLKSLLLEEESKLVSEFDIQIRRGSFMWSMFMGGILSRTEEEETWFAERIARFIKTWHIQGPECRTDIEDCLKYNEGCFRLIWWPHSLKMPECVSLWNRVDRIRKGD